VASLEQVGPNRVAEHPEKPLWRLALDQWKSLVVLLLLASLLGTVPLVGMDWLVLTIGVLSPVLLMEGLKGIALGRARPIQPGEPPRTS
jgi:Cation transporter/ATPase, N-terminus